MLMNFLGKYLIPVYKRERASQYHQILAKYIMFEQSNANTNTDKWDRIYNMKDE